MPPFKIKKANSSAKYGITGKTIKDIKEKGKEKLKIEGRVGDIIIQLEDNTIIDDDDYLSCLEPQTILVFTVKKRELATDSVDSAVRRPTLRTDSLSQPSGHPVTVKDIANKLSGNLAGIGGLDIEQLQTIANASAAEFSSLHLTDDEIDILQEACHTHLVEREKTSNALELLELVSNKQSEKSNNTEPAEPAPKRKR